MFLRLRDPPVDNGDKFISCTSRHVTHEKRENKNPHKSHICNRSHNLHYIFTVARYNFADAPN